MLCHAVLCCVLPGGNNINSRNPAKHEIKNIYLDAIGEPQDRHVSIWIR
jgi:hypothetical protein